MPRWRFLLTEPARGPENMALDEALMTRAPATLEEAGIAIVRRPTGGRAVLHDREVTYSVTAPATGAGALRESYQRINRLLIDALRGLGVSVEIADQRRAPKLDLTP